MADVSKFLIANLYDNVNHFEVLEESFKSSKIVQIVCPYISENGADWILRHKTSDHNVEIITELTKNAFRYGSQSINAIEKLILSGCQMKYLTKNLHSKVYIFDKKRILISSANMTNGGLKENFEVGMLIEPSTLNPNYCSSADFFNRAQELFNYIKDQSLVLDESVLEILKSNSDLNRTISDVDDDLGIDAAKYTIRAGVCSNRDNISTDLLPDAGFKNLSENYWNVFDNNYSLDQIGVFRNELNDKINPILRSFFIKLKRNPQVKNRLANTVYGFSKNNLLKKYLPFDRYLYVTRDSVSRKAHIGYPSIIFGMGKINGRKFFELRTGIEELNETKLTPNGEKFLLNVRNNIGAFMSALNSLGNGWNLTHGRDGNSVDVTSVTQYEVVNIVNEYLETKKISDFQIRRKFYLDVEADRDLILSSNLVSRIAPEVDKIFVIFDLATK